MGYGTKYRIWDVAVGQDMVYGTGWVFLAEVVRTCVM